MKKIILLAICLIFPLSLTFSQNNIYGDYLFANVPKTISLDLQSANLVDVLKMFSQQTGLNFVSTEAVKDRTLTLYLENVPIKKAMDIIFKANNLTYEYYPEANIFVVKEMGKPSIEVKTKVYRLQYVRLGSTKIQSQANGLAAAGGGQGIKDAVQNALTANGKVIENASDNSLVVMDVPSQFPIIDSLIKKLDVSVKQVMIEVEMLDVSKRLSDQIGVKFENGLYGSFTGPSRTTPFPLNALNPSDATTFWKGGTITMGQVDLSNFKVIMQFLASDSTTKVLARPRILTMANETAEIKISTDEAIGIKKDSTGTDDTTYSIERAETGTRLRVTPIVDDLTNEVSLFVEIVEKAARDSGFTTSEFIEGNIKDPEERSTKTLVRLGDGETLLLGGLIKKEYSKSVTKIPVLGDIPFVGGAFRFKDQSNDERELMVFLTPHIRDDSKKTTLAKAKVGTSSILHREQRDSFRKEAIKGTLDKFTTN